MLYISCGQSVLYRFRSYTFPISILYLSFWIRQTMLLNLFSFCFHIFSVHWLAHFLKSDFYCFGRFCVCMLHEIFTRWLSTLHKIILAHHDDNCECECGFCTSCGDLDTLSIGAFMRLMLCPPSLRFHGSTIPLFDWNCIDNTYDFFPLLVDT